MMDRVDSSHRLVLDRLSSRNPRVEILPECLALEWLKAEHVIEIEKKNLTALVHALSQDLTEPSERYFHHRCTFCPRECQEEVKIYKKKYGARNKMMFHLKQHVMSLKQASAKEREEFTTRNNTFKCTRTVGKHKSFPEELPPSKRLKTSEAKETSSHDDFKQEQTTGEALTLKKARSKSRSKQFTQLKNSNTATPVGIETSTRGLNTLISAAEYNVVADHKSHKKKAGKKCDEGMPWSEGYKHDDQNKRIGKKSTTNHLIKDQPNTLQYCVATKLFATDRSLWMDINQTLTDILERDHPNEVLHPEDREKVLEAMRRWIESVQIYDHQIITRIRDPLTAAERATLYSLTSEDWRRLDAAQDPESKLRLTVYARLLLRDYECYPRKNKPKICRHCDRLYTASTSLYSHLVSLSGIRYWVCSKCKDCNKEDATFTRKNSLQYHILKEVGIPRYECPECNKTHNHTHHQKNHARQHTGEKHYECAIENCEEKFSNRNTYSRHLLQNHNIELTRRNELHEIDQKEAQLKVMAAKLKARERSKNKRLSQVPGSSEVLKKFDTLSEGRSQSPQDVFKMDTIEQKPNDLMTQQRLEMMMRPSASQLLCGIARDVRNNIEDENSSDHMMGGLNLLATVSKYMNAECTSATPRMSVKKESVPPFQEKDVDSSHFEDLREDGDEHSLLTGNENVKCAEKCQYQDGVSCNVEPLQQGGLARKQIWSGSLLSHTQKGSSSGVSKNGSIHNGNLAAECKMPQARSTARKIKVLPMEKLKGPSYQSLDSCTTQSVDHQSQNQEQGAFIQASKSQSLLSVSTNRNVSVSGPGSQKLMSEPLQGCVGQTRDVSTNTKQSVAIHKLVMPDLTFHVQPIARSEQCPDVQSSGPNSYLRNDANRIRVVRVHEACIPINPLSATGASGRRFVILSTGQNINQPVATNVVPFAAL